MIWASDWGANEIGMEVEVDFDSGDMIRYDIGNS